ncbi:pentatricopeptide repeat-containing protein At2g33680-like [Argentina anserina]|uniref:pentatricopeptide repeat-containing protein At2g33680-like n=1 Tax=Argentina anserina TaxID=57926 RepID=UPI00217683F6|nr:pentatricopeptide repeat-containing protein At2g33680-like [Potentilla anserina]
MEIPITPSLENPTTPKDYNLLIKQHARLKNDHAILSAYAHMESLRLSPNSSSLPLVLKACARLKAVKTGKRIHSSLCNPGFDRDVRIGTALVDFYCKCGLTDDAVKVFDEMPERDLVVWNALIHGCVGCGCYEEGVELFREMQGEGLKPNSRSVVALLLACREVSGLGSGKEVHCYGLRNGLLEGDAHVGTALIGFYVRFDVGLSRLVFDSMAVRNVVSWNAVITGYVDVGEYLMAVELFVQLLGDGVRFDSVTMLVVVQACGKIGCVELARQIHQIAVKCSYSSDVFVVNALLNMYSECGCFELSRALFETALNRDVAMWNSMLAAYSGYGLYEEAIYLFSRMRIEGSKEDERTVYILLSLCEELSDGLREGKGLHALALKSGMEINVSLGNTLLSMYANFDSVESVQKVFSEMKGLDVISWNTLIRALACNGLRDEAWEAFGVMRESGTKPNPHTIISVLAIFKDATFLNTVRAIHGFVTKQGIEVDLSLNTALTEIYMKSGDEAAARTLFEGCPHRDVISWNAIIANYVRINDSNGALLLFKRMISEVKPNSVTIISILSSCTEIASLPLGQCLHAYATRRHFSFDFDLSLANAFISMYARSGSMQYANKIFKSLPTRNSISWNALITGYSMHGQGYDAILMFQQMLEEGFQPYCSTFVAVLSACRHSGMIEMGLKLFHTMVHDLEITPKLAHYGCVVDLLCRAGRLDEAREFIESMPIEPDASVWRALLNGCQVNCATNKLAEEIFVKLVELEPMNAGNYVLLSNVYAAAGLWLEVRKVRTLLREKGLKKPPGTSWIIIKSQVHYFVASDTSHLDSNRIYECLNSLSALTREIGYIPDLLREEEI